jgi:hypothetical protein
MFAGFRSAQPAAGNWLTDQSHAILPCRGKEPLQDPVFVQLAFCWIRCVYIMNATLRFPNCWLT